MGPLVGVGAFLNLLDKLLSQEQSRGPTAENQPIAVSLAPRPNAVDLLLCGSCPIRPKDLQQHRKLLHEQKMALERFVLRLHSPNLLRWREIVSGDLDRYKPKSAISSCMCSIITIFGTSHRHNLKSRIPYD